MLGTLIGVWFWSLVGCLGVYSFDRVLPLWTKDAYFAFDLCFRARKLMVLPGASILSKCKWFFAFLFPASLVRFFTPAGRELLVYQGFSAYYVPFLLVTISWLMADGPPNDLKRAFDSARDSTIVYTIGAFTVTHPRQAWWCLVYTTAPLLGVAAALYVPYLRTPVRWVLVRTVVPILEGVPAAWDRFDIWEAYIVERIPKSLTHAWSRNRQRHPQRLKLPKYQYRRLEDGEIRLLVLRKPRWFIGVVNASIVHQPIDPSPDYEAVSYRWGSSERTDEILINGCRFGVTKSAYDLLIARRSIWRDRTIWIDAICINQDDNQEKGAQVQLMCEIYRRASRVVVYTGRDWRARYTAPLAFELIAAQFQYEGSDVEFANWTSQKLNSVRWRTLIELFTDEYFNRAWIVQEIAVAHKVEIYYGGVYIPWDLFVAIIEFCTRPQQQYLLGISGEKDKRLSSGWQSPTIDNIIYLFLMRPQSDGTESKSWDLESLLFATARFRATDSRDKVFAILGLVTDASHGHGLIKPDYTKSVAEVYEDAARMVLLHNPKKRQSVYLLALAGIGFHEDRQVTPSWVPDFTEERACFLFTSTIHPTYSAGGQSQAAAEPGHLSRSLNIRALEVDRIMGVSASGAYTIGAVEGQHVSISHLLRTKKAFIDGVLQLCTVHGNLWPAGEDVIRDRLWFSLVAGRMQSKQVDARFREVFPCWLGILEQLARAGDVDALDAGPQSSENDEGAQALQRFWEDGSIKQYDVAVTEAAYGKRFAITAGGRLCLVPPLTEVSDAVVIPLGAQTPFLVREAPLAPGAAERAHRLVGEAYVEGCMYGELMGDPGASRWWQLV